LDHEFLASRRRDDLPGFFGPEVPGKRLVPEPLGFPTSPTLDDEQVDRLIAAGRNILHDSSDYQALLQLLR
jgi:hypothetical protein